MTFCALFHAIIKSNGAIESCFNFLNSVSRINYNQNAPGNQQGNGLKTVVCFDAYLALFWIFEKFDTQALDEIDMKLEEFTDILNGHEELVQSPLAITLLMAKRLAYITLKLISIKAIEDGDMDDDDEDDILMKASALWII
uniref:Uncharacterized protein n=1 Tax=Tetranychus urticae TaxID=32264 RepID=T1KL97_TETUR